MDYQRYIDWADDRIVEDSRTVILVFLPPDRRVRRRTGEHLHDGRDVAVYDRTPRRGGADGHQPGVLAQFRPTRANTQLIQEGTNVPSKDSMLRMLRAQERVEDHDELRVTSTSGAATIVATRLDPGGDDHVGSR